VSRADAVDGHVRVLAESTAVLLPALLATAERLGHRVRDVAIDGPTLEAAFIELTGKALRE
jgi:linearmycin/streptolysin S transport system ATP-binding protein